MKNKRNYNVVVVGGGTGIFPVTSALRRVDDVDITTVVAVSDSGGSTGRIRDEFGFQPVGDLRQSLAALAEESGEEWIRKLLLYRFEKGDGLKGHNLGNLLLTALQDMTGSTSEALFIAKKIFRLKGIVIPATNDFVDLKIVYDDGTEITGEHTLDEKIPTPKKISHIELVPAAEINPYASQAIKEADLVIVGPGDLYASILASLAADGTREAFIASKAKTLYISNLMTRKTQTSGMSILDHTKVVEKAIGKQVDYILINNEPISQAILDHYAAEDEYPVEDDARDDTRAIHAPIINNTTHEKTSVDTAHRSVLRHSNQALQPVLEKVLSYIDESA